jgi:hypothetical protein
MIAANEEVTTYYILDLDLGKERKETYDSLHAWGVLLDSFKYSCCSNDGRVQKLFLDISHFEVERTCCMNLQPHQ